MNNYSENKLLNTILTINIANYNIYNYLRAPFSHVNVSRYIFDKASFQMRIYCRLLYACLKYYHFINKFIVLIIHKCERRWRRQSCSDAGLRREDCIQICSFIFRISGDGRKIQRRARPLILCR